MNEGFAPQIIDLEATDVALATYDTGSTSIERIDAAGRTLWQHRHQFEWGSAWRWSLVRPRVLVATSREIVSIVELNDVDSTDSSIRTYATHVEVLGFDGEQVCTTLLDEGLTEPVRDSSRHRPSSS